MDFTNALSDDNIIDLLSSLRSDTVPAAKVYESNVESSLRDAISEDFAEEEEIPFSELNNDDRKLVGRSANGSTLPWWLKDFDWTVGHREELTISENNLGDLSNFSSKDTKLQSIALGNNHEFKDVLDAILSLEYELSDRFNKEDEVDPEDSDLVSFPDSCFEVNEESIETTDEFKEWFGDLVTLLPPENEVMTALLMGLAGVERGAAEDALTDEAIECLEKVGICPALENGGSVYNEDYCDSFEKLLTTTGCFDLEITPENKYDIEVMRHGESEGIPPLLYQFVDSWASENDRNSAQKEWFDRIGEKIEDEEKTQFAQVVFETPLCKDGSVEFKPSSNGTSHLRKELKTILKNNKHIKDV